MAVVRAIGTGKEVHFQVKRRVYNSVLATTQRHENVDNDNSLLAPQQAPTTIWLVAVFFFNPHQLNFMVCSNLLFKF